MMKLNPDAFWKRTDGILKAQDLTLRDLASGIGASMQSVTAQHNKRCMPRTEQLLAMSRFLKVDLEYLIVGKAPRFTDRIERIAYSCMKADEVDLKLVEKVLGIETAGNEEDGA